MGDKKKIGINPGGLLKPVNERNKIREGYEKALGYGKNTREATVLKKKKKKGGLRDWLMRKSPKYKKLMESLD